MAKRASGRMQREKRIISEIVWKRESERERASERRFGGGGWGRTGSEMNSGMLHSYGGVKITHVRTRVESSVLIAAIRSKAGSFYLYFWLQAYIVVFFCTCACNHCHFNSRVFNLFCYFPTVSKVWVFRRFAQLLWTDLCTIFFKRYIRQLRHDYTSQRVLFNDTVSDIIILKTYG